MSLSTFSDSLYALRFLRLLTTKWERTNAYKKGIIDKDGNQILKSKDIPKTDKRYYNIFHRLVFNVKRLLQKTPIVGKSILTNYAAGLLMLKEHLNISSDDLAYLLSEINVKFQINENSSHHQSLKKGYEITTKEDLVCLETYEQKIKKNSVLVIEEYVDTIFSVPVYLAREKSTNLTTYVSINENISVSTGSVGAVSTQPLPIMRQRRYTTLDVDDDVFNNLINPKIKYKHWKNYISLENESYCKIKKCVQRGDMVVIRNPKGAAAVVRNYKKY